jgi:hypothetical protein
MTRGEFLVAYKRHLDDLGLSYDTINLEQAWGRYQRDPSAFYYLFEFQGAV